MSSAENAHLSISLPEVYPGGTVPVGWKVLVEQRRQFPGASLRELAKTIGVNQQTVYSWVKKPEYQRYENWVLTQKFEGAPETKQEAVRDAVAGVKLKYETYLDEMFDRLQHILETTESEKLQTEIILDGFDRVGLVSKKDAAARVTPILVTPEVMQEFMDRASEAGLMPRGAQNALPGSRAVLDAELIDQAS
jgi:transposase-like protein